jgi:hypothetical protein
MCRHGILTSSPLSRRAFLGTASLVGGGLGELEWPAGRLPAIPAYEFSGVVVAAASDVNDVARGEEVYALGDFDRDGAAADYRIVRKEAVARKPESSLQDERRPHFTEPSAASPSD